AIHAFEPDPPGPEQEANAARVTEQLAFEMGRYRDVRTVLQPEPGHWWPSRREARFSLRGRLREEDGGLLVTARLMDGVTGEQVWGDEYHAAPRPGRWSGTLDDIGRVIAARVGADEGVIVQLLARERRRIKPADVTPYGAMLL